MNFQIGLVLFETDHKKQESKPIDVFTFDDLDERNEAKYHFAILKTALIRVLKEIKNNDRRTT